MQGSYISRRSFIGIAGMSALAVAGFGLAGCSGSNGGSAESGSAASGKKALSGTITAVGSTALQPLCEAAAEQFMQENPGVQITVQGGGSGQGVTQIAQGAVQIGNSDVFAESKLKDSSDISKIADNKVCIVGMAPIVNADVTIDDIKLEDLKKIFTGEIANWSEVDGVEPDAQNVEDNSWKIWSYEHMYTAASPDEATKAFLEYMMGEEVQGGLVEQQGYIPMSGMKVEKDASGKVSNK